MSAGDTQLERADDLLKGMLHLQFTNFQRRKSRREIGRMNTMDTERGGTQRISLNALACPASLESVQRPSVVEN
jgi:hypothetical protein